MMKPTLSQIMRARAIHTDAGLSHLPADIRRFISGVMRGPSAASGGGDIVLNVIRVDPTASGQEVAPFNCWLRAVVVSGAAVSEVAETPGNDTIYDPTQHRMTYVWELPDESYSPVQTPNIPNAWRTHTTDYGKQISVVFTTPGNKTVRCYAFDEAGNWGFGEHKFGGADADSNTIQDPEVLFLNRTVYVSNGSLNGGTPDFSQVPPGTNSANLLDNLADVRLRLNAITNAINAGGGDTTGAGSGFRRVLFLRGETWEETNSWDPFRNDFVTTGGVIGAFGSGTDRVIWDGLFPLYLNDRTSRYTAVMDMDIRGTWQSWTETGAFRNGSAAGRHDNSNVTLFHRCKWDGFNYIGLATSAEEDKYVTFHDCEVTNWKNFGLFEVPDHLAYVWCDLHQHEDALSGVNLSENGNSNAAHLGNLHGPHRGRAAWFHISRTSFFSRCGWSTAANDDFVNGPPTAGQPCLRISGEPLSGRRDYHNVTMSTFEGTGDMLRHQHFDQTGPDNKNHNLIYDKILMCATANTGAFVGCNFTGLTVRNWYAIRPDVPRTPSEGTNPFSVIFNPNSDDWGDGSVALVDAPDTIYNGTAVFLGNGAGINTNPAILPTQNLARPTATAANNVIFAPGFTTSLGDSFAPQTSDSLAGFVPRYKGDRWNFPPIGLSPSGITITVGAARELETGTGGAVANGEWLAVPYPDYTGKCRGALDTELAGNGAAGLRALILANSTQDHQFSTANVGLTVWNDQGASPKVVFDFSQTDRIRIQNNTGATWPLQWPGGTSGALIDTRVFLQLDLSDYLMDFVPGTASPVSIPAPIFTGSGIVSTDALVPQPYADFFGALRRDNVDPDTGNVITTGTRKLGAVA